MQIRALIERYLAGEAEVWDLGRSRVPVERLRSEYAALRDYLLATHAPGERVGLHLERDYRYLLCVLACMETGVVFVPLRLEWPMARIAQIRDIAALTTLITDDVAARALAAPRQHAGVRLAPVRPDQPLYCMFTSGTTGAPKGVVIRRASYANFLAWCGEFFRDVGSRDRLLNSTDYTFDVALAEVALALTRGAAFVCSRFRDDLFTLLAELDEQRVSVIATVPNNLMMLLDERLVARADLSPLRHALVAGARFPVALSRQMRRFIPAVRAYNCYGPTEATIYCLARLLGEDERDFVQEDTVSVGKALAGCAPLVVDDAMRPLPPMQRGELLVGGVQVMEGYLDDPEATRRAIVDLDGGRYYRTGDVAFTDSKGDFYVTGRNDDTVKVSGQRVNLSDIDGYVQRLDFVKSCATIAIEEEVRGALLVLYVVPSYPVARETVLAALHETLPRHQLPQDLRLVESLPVNNSGKVSKTALRDMYLEERVGAGR